jgi:exodeoxyribonuclease-3
VKITTWNVNSVRARTAHVVRFLEQEQPDLLLLQEIKCEEPAFPTDTFAEAGYHSTILGQKSYNGVAILCRAPVTVTARGLPGLDDVQARYLEIEFQGVRVGNLYLPNGNSGGDDGYAYKLRWMDALAARARDLLIQDIDFVLAGDFNVCPASEDLAPGTLPPGDALVRAETRARFRALLWLGLTDAVRALHPHEILYSFWDYQAGCWPRDKGLRIDHALLSPKLAECLTSALPDRMVRGEDQPSDHCPVTIELGLAKN